MRYLDKRINGICNELEKLAIVQKEALTSWQIKDGNYVYPTDADASEEPWKNFDSLNMHWYGPDRHYWFRTTLTVPESFEGKSLWLNIRTQIDEWDDAKNPQFLIYINKKPVQGVDMNHRKVFITDNAKAGDEYVLDLQAYTGILHTEFNFLADVIEIDPMIQKLYYDLRIPLNAFDRMEETDRDRMALEDIMNDTINLLDLRTPYSKEFYASLEEAVRYIDKHLYEERAGYDDIIATCIGHTHIDVAWWWTVEQTREKVGRSFATVLKLMDEFPNYRFMSSQPQLYAFLKERYPDLYAKVKERVAEGRWEPEGGMWVEADCNLTSGESLVRQFLHGKRFFKDEFGVENKILWLPDVFGYSGALPQIMKRSGIDYFMTTKLAWNQINKMPYDTLMWRGIDGSEVLTHLITTLGVGQSAENFFTTYNGDLHPDAIMGGWERYQNKDINNDILISYGYGDGGGGPTRQMLETSKRMEKGIKGIPKVRQEGSLTYFKELEERVGNHKRLPVWEGEFYFEYHRGTYTSMARNKRSNRKGEFAMMNLEFLSVLAEKEGVAYPFTQLDALWKTLLINQFHDILPGSSIKEVYEVTKEEYEWVDQESQTLIGKATQSLVEGQEGLTVYNTLGFARDTYVTVESGLVGDATGIKEADGSVTAIQKSGNEAVLYVKNLPAKGYRSLELVTETVESAPVFSRDEHVLTTPHYVVTFDADGHIISLVDKEADREVIQSGEKANLLRMYEDKPIYYDNWDIDMYYTEKFWDADALTSMEWIEEGEQRTSVKIVRHISQSVIEQTIRFYADSKRIDFETYVDWKEHQHLLKVHFPVDIHTDEATFDIQFGNLTRKVHQNTSWDEARFESCGHKWMDLSEGHYGVSLLNDCKYGHSVNDSNMALTLIKSGIEPNPTTDQEEHYFTYALYPHVGGWRQGGTIKEAYDLNVAAIVQQGQGAMASMSYASVDVSNVQLETIKKAEADDGVVYRLFETDNSKTKMHVTLYNPSAIVNVYECDLMENIEREVVLDGDGITEWIKPYEVKTYKVVYG